jgi:hypothetical protein
MVPKGDPREHKFTMVLSHEEHEMLLSVAERDGRSAASWLRQAIRTAYGPGEPKSTRATAARRKPKK